MEMGDLWPLLKFYLPYLTVGGIAGGSFALAWVAGALVHPRLRRTRLRALADELQQLHLRMDAGEATAGECHEIKVLLGDLKIKSPSLLSPRIPMPSHNRAEWCDFLARVAAAARIGDINMARDAAFRTEFDWDLVDQAMAATVTSPSRFVDAVRDSLADHPRLLAFFFSEDDEDDDQ